MLFSPKTKTGEKIVDRKLFQPKTKIVRNCFNFRPKKFSAEKFFGQKYFSTKNFAGKKNWRRKRKGRESSETRFAEVSCRSERYLTRKRPFKVVNDRGFLIIKI